LSQFEWKPEYSVQIASIDAQHLKLVRMINDLYEAIEAGRGKEALIAIIQGLESYVETHFAYEEDLFARFGYPETSSHKAEHEKLVQQVRDLRAKLDWGQTVISTQVMMFLTKWLVAHIQGSDKKYVSHLVAAGVK
jgi:hemerythrin